MSHLLGFILLPFGVVAYFWSLALWGTRRAFFQSPPKPGLAGPFKPNTPNDGRPPFVAKLPPTTSSTEPSNKVETPTTKGPNGDTPTAKPEGPGPTGNGTHVDPAARDVAEKYLRATPHASIPPNSSGGAPLFVNIQSTKRDVTVLFDGYNKDVRVPDSNAVRGEVCDSNVHQVYWYFKSSRSVPNAYTIEQRHTGLILTYPTKPIAGSQLIVKQASQSLWEIRDGPEDWILTPVGTSLALTLSEDLRQVTLQHASADNLSQQWWCQRSRP